MSETSLLLSREVFAILLQSGFSSDCIKNLKLPLDKVGEVW